MSKKSKEARRLRDQEALERANAATPAVSHETIEEANAALSETARVINMKGRMAEMSKKKGGKSASGATAKAKTAKVRADGLPELPGLPKTRSAAKQKPLVPCSCGCNETTRARFAPGHDSYFRGIIARIDRKIMTLDDVEKIVGKGQRDAAEAFLVERKKQERAAAREAKKGNGTEEAAAATGTDE